MLRDIVFEKETITYRKVRFMVGGVSVDDIAALMFGGERDQLESAFNELTQLYAAAQSKNNPGIEAGLTQLVVRLPGLVAKAIAIAAGEPDQVDTVRLLPVPVQLEALLAIGRMTFDGEDSIRNFVSGLTTLLTQMRKTVTKANGILPPPTRLTASTPG